MRGKSKFLFWLPYVVYLAMFGYDYWILKSINQSQFDVACMALLFIMDLKTYWKI